MANHRKLERDQELFRHYREGVAKEELAILYNISIGRVARILSQQDWAHFKTKERSALRAKQLQQETRRRNRRVKLGFPAVLGQKGRPKS